MSFRIAVKVNVIYFVKYNLQFHKLGKIGIWREWANG